MNKNFRGTLIAIVIVSIVTAILFYFPSKYLPVPTATPKSTVVASITPTSTNTYFSAHINIDSPCRKGTGKDHDVITTIPQGRDVMVIGKDGNIGNWILVRWGSFSDCWIEEKLVTTDVIDLLDIIPTSPAPTFTLTHTQPPTLTPTKTKVSVISSPTRKQNQINDSKTPIPPSTNPPPTNPPPTNPPPPTECWPPGHCKTPKP